MEGVHEGGFGQKQVHFYVFCIFEKSLYMLIKNPLDENPSVYFF